jgi:phosphonate transport system substrate-binding protein
MMKTILVAATAALMSTSAFAQDAITEFRIGILGGENAQDRLTSNECLRAYTPRKLLGVPVKLFAPADYNGVIQGLLGGTIDMAWLGASSYAKRLPDRIPSGRAGAGQDQPRRLVRLSFDRFRPQGQRHHLARRHEGQGLRLRRPELDLGLPDPVHRDPAGNRCLHGSGDYFGEVKFTGGHEQTIVAVPMAISTAA